MHTNALLVMVEAALVLTLVGRSDSLLKKMKAPSLHRTKTESRNPEHRIWRDSIHHGRRVSSFSVIPDRLETGQVIQTSEISHSKNLWLVFLSRGVEREKTPDFRFRS